MAAVRGCHHIRGWRAFARGRARDSPVARPHRAHEPQTRLP
ncbi:MAG: hypothetical protein AVDCRST_MAG68-2452 [uncultured Gemmatimonadetes bacterium]|uniref:Uncharacterized protein n=1 Tax=uncultured Gemmatimonadota bacterium TaxID=203437 RepID=A0A6J4LFU9_9BACT|nr:MAG: hypothetical protein AVDCRST_MAG68-2452 [uncultured Gemmatimonadota bacterium]